VKFRGRNKEGLIWQIKKDQDERVFDY
jgi:hypothetical protein